MWADQVKLKVRVKAYLALLIISLLFFPVGVNAYTGNDGHSNFKVGNVDVEAEYRFGFVGSGIVETEDKASAFIPHLDLGFKWDRPHPGPFIWGEIEPVKGFYDFSKTDLYVQAAQEYRIQVVATIWPYAKWDQEYWRHQPSWEPSKGFEDILPESRYKPHDMEAYKAFVKALVERYDGDGIDDMPGLQQPIKYWEVINEPEMGFKGEDLNFFKGTPADYLEVVKATYEAIKEADPEAKVLNGGIAYVPESLSEWNSFWGEFFSLGGGQYIDVVTFHNLNPHVSRALEMLRSYLEKHGINKPIWLTELQIAKGYDPELGIIGEEEQAELIVKACVEGFAEGIEKIFYTAYIENPQLPEMLSKAALIKFNGTPKRAYYAYKTMIILLEDFNSVEKLGEGLYEFNLKNLKVYVLYPGVSLPKTVTGKVLAVNLEGSSELTDAGKLPIPTNLTFIAYGSEKDLENLQKKLSKAFEKTVEVGKTTVIGEGFAKKVKCADLNGDGKVNLEDLEVLKKAYGQTKEVAGFKTEADLNDDGVIDIIDLAIIASQYGKEKEDFKWTSDVTPGKEAGVPPPGITGDGPWNHRLLLATSNDGIHWNKTYKILADQASVPDVIVDGEGNLRVYYVDYFNGGITVAISSDGGKTWIYKKVKGLTPEWVDPDIVLLSNGQYRLYASYMPLGGSQDKIVSAISEDGINFTPEEGYRYHESGSFLTDPDVFQFKGRWYMIVGPELTLLESEDGINFRKVGKLPFGSGVSCTIPYGEGLRVYFHLDEVNPLKIYLSYTENLENWSKPEVVLASEEDSLDQYGVGDPAVAKLPSGGYIMAYKTWIQKPKQCESSLESKAEKGQIPEFVGLLESILDAEKISDGCYLLKYPSFNLYMLWKPCELAKGAYSFKYGEITFLFDDEKVFEILRSEVKEPKKIDKLKSRLEKLDNRIMLLVSDDGVNWRETEITVAKAATVPDIIVDKDGNLRVYYVSFPANKIRVAISKDAKSWSQYDLEGIESGWVDPEVLSVDGNYILYSSYIGLAIARSEDGLNFKPILHSEELHIMDPTVFKVGEKWYMIAGPGTILFTSEDGLHFKQKKELNLGGEVCDVMEKDGELWLYCHAISKEGSKILRFRSMDGETWTSGTVVYSSSGMVADPSVTFFQGKYYMVVTVSS